MFALSTVFAALSFFVPVLIIAGIVYLIVRARRPQTNGISGYQVLVAYFYMLTAASFFTMVVGLVYFITVALSPAVRGSGIAGDLTLASVLVGTGLIVYALHIYGRRLVEKRVPGAASTQRRVYLFFMLAVFSIMGLVSLPLAINEIVRHFVLDTGRFLSRTPLALAIVFVPLWAYFMFSVLGELRRKGNGEETGPDLGATSSQSKPQQ